MASIDILEEVQRPFKDEASKARNKTSQVEFFACVMMAEGPLAFTQQQMEDYLDFVSTNWRAKKEVSLKMEGKRHWQIAFRVHGKSTVKRILDLWKEKYLRTDGIMLQTAHNWQALKAYIAKKATADGEIIRNKQWISRRFQNCTLRPWQKSLLDLQTADNSDRIIDLVYDPKGSRGKSWFGMYIAQKGLGYNLAGLTTAEKAIESLNCMLTHDQNRDPTIIVMDIPRRAMGVHLEGWLRAMEQIKNGQTFDPRYVAKYWWFEPPKIFVFVNELPNLEGYTEDRLRFWKINNNLELKAIPFDTMMRVSAEIQRKATLAKDSQVRQVIQAIQSVAEAILGSNKRQKLDHIIEKIAMEDTTEGDNCDNSVYNQSQASDGDRYIGNTTSGRYQTLHDEYEKDSFIKDSDSENTLVVESSQIVPADQTQDTVSTSPAHRQEDDCDNVEDEASVVDVTDIVKNCYTQKYNNI